MQACRFDLNKKNLLGLVPRFTETVVDLVVVVVNLVVVVDLVVVVTPSTIGKLVPGSFVGAIVT